MPSTKLINEIFGASAKVKTEQFVPINNYEKYLEDMEINERRFNANFEGEYKDKLDKATEKRINRIRERHEKYYAENPPTEDMELDHVNKSTWCDPDHVILRSKIVGDKVKVSLIAPTNDMYHNYNRKGTNPPERVLILAAKQCGFDTDQIKNIIKKKRDVKNILLDTVIYKEGESKKKTSKRKRVPLRKRLAAMMVQKQFVVIDDEDKAIQDAQLASTLNAKNPPLVDPAEDDVMEDPVDPEEDDVMEDPVDPEEDDVIEDPEDDIFGDDSDEESDYGDEESFDV
jgi:hypothetical protein